MRLLYELDIALIVWFDLMKAVTNWNWGED